MSVSHLFPPPLFWPLGSRTTWLDACYSVASEKLYVAGLLHPGSISGASGAPVLSSAPGSHLSLVSLLCVCVSLLLTKRANGGRLGLKPRALNWSFLVVVVTG